MARTTISIPDDLRAEMNATERPPNWSSIAAAAFREYLAATKPRTEKTETTTIVERMKATAEIESHKNQEFGYQQGQKWARDYAKPRQLRRLAAARHPVEDWSIEESSSAFSCGDMLAEIINDEKERNHFTERMIDDEFSDLENDPHFVQGFAEGCIEVWGEVKGLL